MTLTRGQLGDRAREDLARLRSPAGWLRAGLPRFARLFGRDSAISAIQVLDDNPEVAAATIRALAACQGTAEHRRREEEPGRIAHEVPDGWRDRVRLELRKQGRWGFPYYGSVDATAWWVRLVAAHAERTGSTDLVDEVRPGLVAAARWWAANRTADPRGFVTYRRRNPAGLEHQGWRDADMGAIAMAPPVAVVEVQGYVLDAARALDRLGVAVPPGGWIDADAFRDAFWWPEEGTCSLALDGGGEQVRVVTSNAGHLLGTGALDADGVAAVVSRLLADDLWTPAGLRTLSTREPTFDPRSYQRGSVWPHDNWVFHQGLLAEGRPEEAATVRAAVLDACARLEHVPELYAVVDGRPEALAVAQAVQAWSCGAVLSFLAAERDAG